MKRTVLGVTAPLAMVATVIFAATVFSQSPQLPSGPARGNQSVIPHPLIHRAITALENARADLQDAAHDYCGHRAAALESVNHALEQLHRAIECDNARGASTGDLQLSESTVVAVSAGGMQHPRITRAIEALSTAKGNLEDAAQVYCGHRAEALESVNHAIEQLRAGIACGR